MQKFIFSSDLIISYAVFKNRNRRVIRYFIFIEDLNKLFDALDNVLSHWILELNFFLNCFQLFVSNRIDTTVQPLQYSPCENTDSFTNERTRKVVRRSLLEQGVKMALPLETYNILHVMIWSIWWSIWYGTYDMDQRVIDNDPRCKFHQNTKVTVTKWLNTVSMISLN